MKFQYLLRDNNYDINNAVISAVNKNYCHYEHELNIIYKGNCVYKDSSGNNYNLTPGSIFFIFTGAFHAIQVDNEVSMWIMHINPEYLLKTAAIDKSSYCFSILNEHLNNDFMHLRDPLIFQKISGYLTDIKDYKYSVEAWEKEIARLNSELLMIEICKLINNDNDNESDKHKSKSILSVRNWINHHFTEDITLQQLSEMSELSPSHFSTTFHKQIGLSPQNYIISKRINNAAILLKETNQDITEVALKSGFNDLSYFYHCFKKYHQISPGKYRKINQ